MQRIIKRFPDCKFKFYPDIVMIHLEGHSMSTVSLQAMMMNFKSSLYYCQKYGLNALDIYRKLYKLGQQKLFIDSIVRPDNVVWRKQYLQMLEEKFSELKE